MSVLFPQTYQYKAFSTGKYVNGRITSDYLAESFFVGSIQPATQKELNSANIGRENRGMIKIYTDKVFNIAREGSNINSDIIIYDGNEYEIIKLDNNTGTLLPHRRYFAEIRINDNLGYD